MTKDIVQKLRNHLAESIDTECGVVYLLAEVRKLLERNKPDPKPIALWMYCHWALHVNLSITNTTLRFLEPIDTFITHTVAGWTERGSHDFYDEERLFREFAYLSTFRDQLRAFFMQYGLPTDLCDEDDKWYSFLAAYGEVIRDGELSSETKANDGLVAVERVTFKVGDDLTAEYLLPFIIVWDIHLKDRSVMHYELKALKATPNMMTCLGRLIPAQ